MSQLESARSKAPATGLSLRSSRNTDLTAPSVLLITGMSGAGKSSALKALQDLGYETVDNVPLSLLERLVLPEETQCAPLSRPLAIGVHVWTRDFGVDALDRLVEHISARRGADIKLIFLDCDDETLKLRYSATRHRHPLAPDRPIGDGIARERQIMSVLRDRATINIDTSVLNPHELKRIIDGYFGLNVERGMIAVVMSFSFRFGLPREADLVFDVRFLKNPFYEASLRALTGDDERVANYIMRDEAFGPFFQGLTTWLKPVLPRYVAEGKSYLTIAVGCTGGRHRSVFVAEKLHEWISKEGLSVQVFHRDKDLSGSSPSHSDRI